MDEDDKKKKEEKVETKKVEKKIRQIPIDTGYVKIRIGKKSVDYMDVELGELEDRKKIFIDQP